MRFVPWGASAAPEPGVEDESNVDEAGEEELLQSWEWTSTSALLTKAFTVLLWVGLVAGPAALVFGLVRPPAVLVQAATQTTAVVDADEQTAVSGFAEAFVVSWLTTVDGDQDELEPFMPGESSTITLPRVATAVDQVTTSGLVETQVPHLWSVTVSAVVTDPTGPGTPGRRWFRVPVVFTDGAMVAQTLPAPMAAPASAETLETGYGYQADSGGPVGTSVQEFLDALLTGRGDVSRYIAPGTDLAAIVPAPYDAVKVDQIVADLELVEDDGIPQNADELRVLVTASGVTKFGKKFPDTEIGLQYLLTLTARGGRWEISAIDRTPVQRVAAPEPTEPPPSTSPGGTSTAVPASPTTTD